MRTKIQLAIACALVAAVVACSGGGGGGGGNNNPGNGGPALSLSTSTVTFAATESGGALPMANTVSVTNSGTGTLAAPTLTISYGTGTGWLDASYATSGAGYTITLRPNTTALAAGTRSATVQVACAGASGSPKAIGVSWQVTANPNPVIVPTPSSLSFTAQVGDPDPASTTLEITNGGGGALAAVTVSGDQGWLAPSIVGSTVTVSVALSSAPVGDDAGHVILTSAGAVNSPLSVPVTFHVLEPTLSVATAELDFAANPGANPPEQTRAIGNSGTGTLRTVSAAVSYTTGSGWITATVTGTGNSQVLHVAVTTPGSVGTYDAKVTVSSASTTNGWVDVPVHLVVSATPPAISADQASLSFTTTAGTSPAAQQIQVTNTGGGTLAAVTATPSYTDGSGWMGTSLTGSGNAQTVTVSITAPAAGTYHGAVSLASAGASNTPVSIPVTLTVNPSSGGGADTSTPSGAVAAILAAQEALGKACYVLSSTQQTLDQAHSTAMASALQSAVDAKRVSYSKSQADACLAWVSSLTCAQYEYYVLRSGAGLDSNASCAATFIGQLSIGAACKDDAECANGYCAFGSSCPGTCAAFTASGAACQSDSECGPGKICGWNGGASSVCMTPAPAPSGQPCAYGNPACALGSYCDYTQGTPTCTVRLGDGAACTGNAGDECATGLACAADKKCRPLVGAGADCSVAGCGVGFYCSSSSSRCVTMPVAGGDCTDPNSAYGGVQCLDNSYCLGSTSKTCQNGTVGAGGTCNPAGTTAAELCAEPTDGNTWLSCSYPPASSTGTCVLQVWSCF